MFFRWNSFDHRPVICVRKQYDFSGTHRVSGSSVGIVTELRAGRSGDRIPVGRDFPPVQTGPGAHPAASTMGTGSFPGVKYGRGVLLTTNPLLVPRSWKSRAILLPTHWATPRPVTGTLYLYLCVAQLGCWLLNAPTNRLFKSHGN